jgi:hypothetical protein
MQIEQVIGGVNGDTTAQAVQLRMRFLGENFVTGCQLIAFDAAGNNPITLATFPSGVSNGVAGSRILIATANFASHEALPIASDFTMIEIPASYLAAGRVAYLNPAYLSGGILWSVSWGGANYTGPNTGLLVNDADGNFAPPFAGVLPSTSTSALLFPGPADALSTNNAADYTVTAGTATFTNNAGDSTSLAGATPTPTATPIPSATPTPNLTPTPTPNSTPTPAATPTPTPASTPTPTPTPNPTPTPSPIPTPTPTPNPTPTPAATPTPTPASTPTPTGTPTPTPRPATLGNISTRLQVGTNDRVMIAGFIVQGNAPKRVLIRAAGPSLTQFGVPNALANPRLELHDTTNTIGMNDDWQTTQIGGVITSDQVAEIQNSGLAPRDPLESALIATLPPGSYTAIVQGVNGGTGVGIVEVYDLDATSGSLLANISTRGFVQTGDNVMIGGFIVVTQPTRVIIRAIGPSLTQFGVPDALVNPQLELHDANSLIGRNDDWQTTQIGGIITSDQVAEIQNSQLAPTNPAESAIIVTLPPGSYTAIVRGVNNTTGNALVEVYSLQ